MDRRNFLKTTAAAGALAVAPINFATLRGPEKKYISDRIILGNTGIEVSRLAVGTGTNGWAGNSNQTRELGIKGLASLLQSAYERGVYFWDSADQYGTHPHLKEALKHLPREKIVILTKTHATTEDEMKADLDRFRSEIGTDYLDIMLLHLMQDGDWPDKKAGAMEVLSKAREEGIIRAHGVSCHTLRALKTAAKTDWVQVDMARMNPRGMVMDATVPVVAEVLQEMKSKGKGVIGMKIIGAGKLTNEVEECLSYALSRDYLDCFTIGIQSKAQLTDLEKRVPAASLKAV